MTDGSVPRPCAGLLLTGGASRRFGAPKAESTLGGATLADRGAAVLLAACAPVLEVGPGYSALDATREDPPGSGPLAAVAAGMVALVERGVAGDVVVLAVDLPHVSVELVMFLRDHPGPGAVVPVVGGIAQSLCARYPAATAGVAVGLMRSGERSMRALLDALAVTRVEEREWRTVASAREFADVDTPDDAWRSGVEGPG